MLERCLVVPELVVQDSEVVAGLHTERILLCDLTVKRRGLVEPTLDREAACARQSLGPRTWFRCRRLRLRLAVRLGVGLGLGLRLRLGVGLSLGLCLGLR